MLHEPLKSKPRSVIPEAMGDKTQRGIVSRTATSTSSMAVRFCIRWLIWSAVIGTPGFFVAEWLWPHVYELWGPPLQMFQKETFQAVLFGDLVASLMGGAAVAFVGTFRR
jgi:hypothetical protein